MKTRDEIDEEEVDEDESVVQKPPMVFEDEFEIITDDAELEDDDDEDVEEPEPKPDVADVLSSAMSASQGGNEKLAAVIESLEKTLRLKEEKPKPIDMEAELADIADKLSDDPKEAVKKLTQIITGQVGGALQYQNGQIRQTQAQASSVIARGNETYGVVFENWSDEVEEKAKTLLNNPQVDAANVYNLAAQEVMMAHISDVVRLEAEKIATGRASARPKKQKLSQQPGTPPIEGQVKRAVYKFTPQDKAWAEKQMNPKRAYAKLIKDGRAVKVR